MMLTVLPPITKIYQLIAVYRYGLIFPLAIIEGPIITIIVGFLASLGQFSFFYSFLILVLGDLVGDSILYLLGKYGKTNTSMKLLKFLGLTKERIVFIEKKFIDHPKKIFTFGKMSHGGGAAVLFAAGIVEFPFGKFLIINLILTLIKSFILILVGYYFGQAYVHIKHYLDYAAILFGLILVAFYIIFLRISSYYLNENTNRNR